MQVQWIKCSDAGSFCNLNTVDLDHENLDGIGGIYLIWYDGGEGEWVRVGQGEIRERLKVHREDSEVQAYASNGLYVTWAVVDPSYRNGVERYLGEYLKPIVGTRFPDATPISVNLP